jgi:protocatechuate 3,4-dioxygenase beta subunit
MGLYLGFRARRPVRQTVRRSCGGTQFIGADGEVHFATIYPGWYPGRTPHIHFKVFIGNSNVITGQLYFPEPITKQVYATTVPYRGRKEERDTFSR